MHKLIPHFAALPALGLVITAGVHAAPAKSSYGTVKPFTLSATALQNVSGQTDLTLTVNAAAGFAAPTQASHIQLKSFDTAGELRWTKNSQDVALAAAGASSQVTQTFTDLSRRQPVQAFVQVQNGQTVNKENLNATIDVKLRPDVTVESVSSPTRIVVNQIANFAALVRELNGDLGASVRVRVTEGGNTLDTIASLTVNPHGSTSAVFSAIFTTPGTHTLTVTADNVNPGDYDLSNNSRTLTVEVVNNLQTTPFRGGFWSARDRTYYSEWNNWYGYGTETMQGTEESMWVEIRNLPASTKLDTLSIDFGADGVLNPATHVERTNLVVPGDNYYGYSTQLDTNTWLYVYSEYWSGQRMLQVSRYAGDRVYFSQYYNYYWGNSTNSSTLTGAMLRPATSFNARIVVGINGTQYGGSVTVPVATQHFHNEWNYYDYYYYYGYSYGYDDYTWVNGYTEGTTTP